MPLSDTWFTASPGWHWLVVGYFFVGGIAAGAFFLACLADLAGSRADRELARTGYLVAFPAIALGGLFLIADLGRPERFWHMLWMSQRPGPLFKWWSPMSVGSWALTLFGLFAFVAFAAVLAEEGRLRVGALARLRSRPAVLLLALGGAPCGFFLASYTGVLLAVTNRPIWSDTPLIGALFLLSSASTAIAVLTLAPAGRRSRELAAATARLQRLETPTLVLELVTLIALVISLGPVARAWWNGWGIALLVGVVMTGILLPVALNLLRRHEPGGRAAIAGALLVLAGGFLLRAIVVFSAEAHG